MLKYIILALTVISVYSITCDAGEFADGGKCKSCSLHCSECSSATVCTVCESGFYLDEAADSCLRQEITNCIKIDAAATKQCTGCASGYWLNNDHSCVAGSEGCTDWEQGVATENCTEVAEGYYIDGTTSKACSLVHAQCSACSSATMCIECITGYFLAANKVCQKKTKHCLTWMKSTTEACDECPAGYEKNNDDCYATGCLEKCFNGKARSSQPACDVSCNDTNCEDCTTNEAGTCKLCKSDKQYELIGGKCYFITNCATYHEVTGDCTQCNTGYLLDSNNCDTPCTSPCQTCSTVARNCTSCIDGAWYNSDAHACSESCIAGCKVCTEDAKNKCTTCNDGYTLTTDEQCVGDASIIAHCETMATINTCGTCEAAFWKNGDGIACTACPDNCADCTSQTDNTTCTTCKDGYYLNDDKTCTICLDNCKTCPTVKTNACGTCEAAFWKNGDGTACTACPANCADCTSQTDNTKCTTCKDGYYLNDDKTCTKCIDNCNVCTTIEGKANKCGTCEATFWKNGDGTACTACPVNCADCTSQTTCTTCKDGYYLNDDKTCTKCLDNCKTCPTVKTNACGTCEAAFWKNGDGTACTACPANCADCTSQTDNTKCTTCKDGYYLNDDKTCTKCIDNCNVCTTIEGKANKCGTCEATFWKNGDGTACTACPANCADCTSQTDNTTCTTCKDGYYLNDDKTCTICLDNCKTCPTVKTNACGTCEAAFWKNGDGTACTACPANCADCTSQTDNTKCTTCKDGYYLNDASTCTKCIDNCKICSNAEGKADTCGTCEDEYTLTTNKKCVTIFSNCITMATPTECGECEPKYYISQDDSNTGQCVQCEEHCLLCTEGKKCTQCEDDYYLAEARYSNDTVYSAICVSCTDYKLYTGKECSATQWRSQYFECSELSTGCSASDPTPIIGVENEDCMTCKAGYKLNDGNTSCVVCPNNCINCQGTHICDGCKDGYYLNTTDYTCVQCDATTCQKCSATECLDCKESFGFPLADATDKKVCLSCLTNCERCDVSTVCIQCKVGFYLKIDDETTTCPACSTGCSDCNDDTLCYKCTSGYYLDSAACKQCVDHCTSCTDGESCDTCETGYELDSDKKGCTKKSTSTPDGTECLSITDCIACSVADSTQCALCKSGSIPVDNKCTCETDEILIGGECVKQESEMPEDISEKTLAEISKLITVAQTEENTKTVLERVSSILSDSKTKENAETSLQLLVSLSDTATDAAAETAFKSILTDSCAVSGLEQTQFKIAFTAADKFMKTASDPQAIYETGFSTCLKNLLKLSTIEDIPLMQLTNGEYIMKKFKKADGEKSLTLTGITITANEDFMDSIESSDELYACAQSINKDSNPYKNESTNTITLSSKIVSLTVMSSGDSPAEQTVELADNKTFPIKFDATVSGAACGYYDTANKKWVQEGSIDDKTCSFTHLTDFAIFKIDDEGDGTDGDNNAYIIKAFSILLVFIIAMF